ncbi:MAG: Lrp/AsnC family transcriptional regulator [Rikenellaceae bacterium]
MEEYILDQLDYKILKLISNDARISFLEVARICNVSGAAVHQRVQKMIVNGFITGSQFRLNLKRIGYTTCVYLSLKIGANFDLTKVVDALKEIEEIAECHQTIGTYDLFVKLYARDNGHLLEIIQNKLKPIGVVDCQSMVSYDELFHRQITFSSVEK